MATNFPNSLDNLTNPASTDPIDVPSHSQQHTNANDAIEALEAKVGVNSSANTTSLDYRVRQLETNPVASYTNEEAVDAVAVALAAGTHSNITINYNDAGNSISISAAAGYTNEEAVDAVALALTAGSGISVSYNDAANTITISVDSTIATKTYTDTAVSGLATTVSTTYIASSTKGSAGGVASLDSNGFIPDTQIPAGIARDSEVSSAISTAVSNLIDSAPGTLDTLNELAAAINDDASYAATITTALGTKAPLASPALTGTPTAPTAAVGTDSTQVATTAFVIDQIDASTQPGALYQTTAPTSPEVGQIWIDSDEDVTTFDSNIIRRKAITATAGQTVFTSDLPFIDGFEQIFMNGLLLVKTTDYTTSNSNTVTLTSAAAVSDIIEIVSVTGANSVDTYTQAEVNALLAANTSVAPLSISANTNLAAKKRYFVASASALTLTLPATPALNDEIQLLDASGNASTYNITVARNGNKINGGTGNLIIDNNGGWYTLLYTGSTYGWKVG